MIAKNTLLIYQFSLTNLPQVESHPLTPFEQRRHQQLACEKQPNYLILFSWHIKNELKKNLRKKGFRGKFIIPLPLPKIEN